MNIWDEIINTANYISENEKFRNQIKTDVDAYRKYNIARYNNDEERASDGFSIREFLNYYTVALHVFNHGCYLKNKKAFNRWINACFYMFE